MKIPLQQGILFDKKCSVQFCPLFQGIPQFQDPLYQGFTVHSKCQTMIKKLNIMTKFHLVWTRIELDEVYQC